MRFALSYTMLIRTGQSITVARNLPHFLRITKLQIYVFPKKNHLYTVLAPVHVDLAGSDTRIWLLRIEDLSIDWCLCIMVIKDFLTGWVSYVHDLKLCTPAMFYCMNLMISSVRGSPILLQFYGCLIIWRVHKKDNIFSSNYTVSFANFYRCSIGSPYRII